MGETVRRLYPVAEAAAQLGIARTTLYSLFESGALSSVKIGRRTLVPAESLDRYIASLKGESPETSGD